MKVSIVGPVYPYRGGIAHYTTSLTQALSAFGHKVQVISFQRQYPGWLYPGKSDLDPSRDPMRVNAKYVLDPLKPWKWFHSAKCIIDEKPDLCVIQWWTTFWAPAFATLAMTIRRRGIRVVYIIHNTLPHETRPWDKFLAKLALHQGQAFVVQTENEKESLLALLPNADFRLCLMPVFQRFSASPIPQKEARNQLGLPENTPILLFFGIVRPYKGLRYLLEALAKLNFENEEVRVIVAGEFWEDIAPYHKLISDLKINDRVSLDNRYIPNEDADLLFSAVDALVAPYIHGTQSAAASLAIGYGLPLIVTEPVAPGIDKNNARILKGVPAKDANALANAVRDLLPELKNLRDDQRLEPRNWSQLVAVLNDLAIPIEN